MCSQHIPPSSNKAIDKEVSSAVQQLYAIQKAQPGTLEEIIFNGGIVEASAVLSIHVQEN